MLSGMKVIVVLPAYKAEKTLEQTVRAIPDGFIDKIILVDDGSDDCTAEISIQLGIKTIRHEKNLGYGANQKTCYREALKERADIVIMLHPDYQYEPRLVVAMAAMLVSNVYDVVLGSRILGNTARSGGMPLYKYIANRFLTAVQNLLLGAKLSEYHTGYRAFSSKVLESLPLLANSDDFVFDNQILIQVLAAGYRVGEMSCPTKYFPEASSINFYRAVFYGFGVLANSMVYRMHKLGIITSKLFSKDRTLQLVATVPEDAQK